MSQLGSTTIRKIVELVNSKKPTEEDLEYVAISGDQPFVATLLNRKFLDGLSVSFIANLMAQNKSAYTTAYIDSKDVVYSSVAKYFTQGYLKLENKHKLTMKQVEFIEKILGKSLLTNINVVIENFIFTPNLIKELCTKPINTGFLGLLVQKKVITQKHLKKYVTQNNNLCLFMEEIDDPIVRKYCNDRYDGVSRLIHCKNIPNDLLIDYLDTQWNPDSNILHNNEWHAKNLLCEYKAVLRDKKLSGFQNEELETYSELCNKDLDLIKKYIKDKILNQN